jgi:DNA-directed RNA polymerase subunit alpha
MFQIQCLKSTNTIATECYSKYSLGPFLKGQSTTIGNGLRRVLLSDLQGIAITGVRIAGIDHEFSNIPNVKEDVIDILLNLKKIVLKGNITEPILARLNVNGSGIIVAGDILFPNIINVVNPKQYIACLTKKANLEMEFLIARGQNYVKSGRTDSTVPERFIAIDAVFMPVLRVNFFIETAKKTSTFELEMESLILEIWTNGGIMPSEALKLSAKILENTFGMVNMFHTNMSEPPIGTSQSVDSKNSVQKNDLEHLKTIYIEQLELSNRVYRCLKRANINTLEDLVSYSVDDLLRFKNFGEKSAYEVCDTLRNRFHIVLK